jgi:hypothetical protein
LFRVHGVSIFYHDVQRKRDDSSDIAMINFVDTHRKILYTNAIATPLDLAAL